MAGWFDKIRRAVEPDEDSYDFDDEEIYSSNDMDDGMIKPNNNAQMGNVYGGNAPPAPQNNFGGYGAHQPPPNNGGGQSQYPAGNQQGGNMTPVSTTALTSMGSHSSVEIKMMTPTDKDYDTVGQIAQHLMNRRAVILNLENTSKEMSRRYLDFLRGVAFAIGGTAKRVSTDTYILSPDNVAVSQDQVRDSNSGRADKPLY